MGTIQWCGTRARSELCSTTGEVGTIFLQNSRPPGTTEKVEQELIPNGPSVFGFPDRDRAQVSFCALA